MSALDAFFESYYRLRPVNATFTGVHVHDRRLPDWSPEGLAAALDEMRSLRSGLIAGRRPHAGASRESTPDLADVEARDRELAIAFLDVQIAEHECEHFQRGNPSLALGEAAFGLVSLMTPAFGDAAGRTASAIERLTALPSFLDTARQSITRDVPEEWRFKCLRECDGIERLLTSGLQRWPTIEAIRSRLADHLLRAGEHARVALDRFRSWLATDSRSALARRSSRDLRASEGGKNEYACGPAMFDLLLSRGHWCTRTREDLAASAAAALDEALARLDERARKLAPGGWPAIQERLAEAHPSVEDYLSTYASLWEASRRHASDARLVTWPDSPIRYVPIPVHTRDAAPFLYYLHYRSPAPFDRLPVHDYVVTPIDAAMDDAEQRRRLRATNDSVIKLNHVVHHGGIGHHVQNHYAYRGASEIGRVAAVDCAARIGMFLGGTMAEGWACYATDLMDEHGFLTPEESLSQQHTRARLLARAVVDIGLHEGSLSFADAVAVYRDRVGMPGDAARAEACKNSMFPGTAVMYWLGTDTLHGLRRDRERTEGASFSLQAFHDRLLGFGSIPVPLIARAWTR
jgi:hypothetical protein